MHHSQFLFLVSWGGRHVNLPRSSQQKGRDIIYFHHVALTVYCTCCKTRFKSPYHNRLQLTRRVSLRTSLQQFCWHLTFSSFSVCRMLPPKRLWAWTVSKTFGAALPFRVIQTSGLELSAVNWTLTFSINAFQIEKNDAMLFAGSIVLLGLGQRGGIAVVID